MASSLGKVYLEQLQRPDLAVYTYRHAIEISTKDAGLVQPSTSGFLGAGIDSSTGSNNLQPTSDLAEAHFQTARALLTGASQANYVITGAQSTGYIRIKSNTEDLAPDSLWAGAHTTAIAHLEAATVVQPSHAAAHLLLANLWRDLGAPDKAIARYKKVFIRLYFNSIQC
jgi:Tfp pilus assembly protein PilF